MRLIIAPYYSETAKLKLLKSATYEQLIEYLLMMTRRDKDVAY